MAENTVKAVMNMMGTLGTPISELEENFTIEDYYPVVRGDIIVNWFDVNAETFLIPTKEYMKEDLDFSYVETEEVIYLK